MNPREEFGIRAQHAGIHVKSYKETYEWYHKVFGFEELPQGHAGIFRGGVFPKMRWITLGDFCLEVYEVQNAKPFDFVDFEWTIGVKHLSFAVKNFRKFVEYIKTLPDVTIVVENDYTESGGAVYLRDNNGILVEITPDD